MDVGTLDVAAGFLVETPNDSEVAALGRALEGDGHRLGLVAKGKFVGERHMTDVGDGLNARSTIGDERTDIDLVVIESERFELKDVVLEIFNEKGQLVWNRK